MEKFRACGLFYSSVSSRDHYLSLTVGGSGRSCSQCQGGNRLSSHTINSCSDSKYSGFCALEVDVQLPDWSDQLFPSRDNGMVHLPQCTSVAWRNGSNTSFRCNHGNLVGSWLSQIFFLAGLAAIPKDLPEAARVDGANEWQVFWYVIRPRLQPIMMILVVLRFGTAMAVIDEYLIFGGFNRAHPTYTWTVFMYDQAFKTGLWRQGFAASIGMVGAVVMMIFVAYLVYIFRSKD